MARSPIDLPRMQNQARPRVAVAARRPSLVPQDEPRAPKARKPRLMRQFELVDRVKQYNPATNEDLLNRAYVYAMRAHGSQKRAFRRSIFLAPARRSLPFSPISSSTMPPSRRRCCTTRSRIPMRPATEIDRLFGHDIGVLVEGLTKLKKLDLVSKEAKQAENLRKLLLAIADDVRVLLIKLADRLHNMRTLSHRPPGGAPADRGGDARHLCAACRAHGHAGNARGARGSGFPRTQSRRLQGHYRASRSAGRTQQKLDHGDRAAACQEARGQRHRCRGQRPQEACVFDLAQDGKQSGRLRAALGYFRVPRGRRQRRGVLPARWASSTPPGRSCPGASRITSRRRSRTITARSTRP